MFRSRRTLLTVESYTRSIAVSPAYFECYFTFCALHEVPTRLLGLPPMYRSLGVRDPYFGCPPLSQPILPILEISLFKGSSSGESSSSGSSSSGFLDRSTPLPYVTDRGSRGEIPSQPFNKEVNQHFYELSNSSRSDGETSVSSYAEVDFCSRGIFYSVCVSDLERIRCRYRLPNEFSLSIPSREAHNRQSGFVTLYEDALMVGLRLPLYGLARDLLI